jgi:predicted sugar kinase
MNKEDQRLIGKEFDDLQGRIVQRLIDGGFNNPDSNTYPFFLLVTDQFEGDWNTMVSQVAENFNKEIRENEENLKNYSNREIRRANKFKKRG